MIYPNYIFWLKSFFESKLYLSHVASCRLHPQKIQYENCIVTFLSKVDYNTPHLTPSMYILIATGVKLASPSFDIIH